MLYHTLLYNNPNLLNSNININDGINGIPASNYTYYASSPCTSKQKDFTRPVMNQTDEKFNEVFEIVLKSYKQPKDDFDILQKDINKRIIDKGTGLFQELKKILLKRGKYIHVVVFTDYDLYT